MAKYTTTKRIMEFLNLYTEIPKYAPETVTGSTNGVRAGWSLANPKVIRGTDTVWFGGSQYVGDGSQYSIDWDSGSLRFVSPPPAGSTILASYWYSDIPDSVIQRNIERAENEIERRTNRIYNTGSITEYFDGIGSDSSNIFTYQSRTFMQEIDAYITDDQSYYQNTYIRTKRFPIISVGSLIINDVGISASHYKIYNEPGLIILTKDSGVTAKKGLKNVEIRYTYGYTSIPAIVEELTTKIAGIYTIENRLLGTPVPLNISAANIGVIKEDIQSLYEALGRRMEVDII